ncbi:hypothetical protein M405DRAFT_804801, partial [Rhizopogon salebrosus TDB-379]
MPVLTSSAFLETQVVILSLPPPQHNFSKNHHDPHPSTTPSTCGVCPRSGSLDDPA